MASISNKIAVSAPYGETTSYFKLKTFFDDIFTKHSIDKIDIVCIGTDGVLFDSVGPLIGTMLTELTDLTVFGTLSANINKKNVREYVDYYKFNKKRTVIAIDACFGETLGNIILQNQPLIPAEGVDDPQGAIGDYCVKIVTIVEKEAVKLSRIGLNNIYSYSKLIVDAMTDSYKEHMQLVENENEYMALTMSDVVLGVIEN